MMACQSTSCLSRGSGTVGVFVLAGAEISGAVGRAYWVWCNGEGWVFICLELQYDKVNYAFGGEKALEQMRGYRCITK